MRRGNTRQAAEILGVDRSTLSKWVAFGKIQPLERIGAHGATGDGAMVFDLDALVEHPLSRRQPRTEATA